MTLHTGAEPSSFALDVYFASGCTADAVLEQHVASCERCAAYLSSLRALSDEPAWSTRARAPRGARRVATLLAAGVLAAGLLWVRLTSEPEYVASKGVPAVQALIRDQSGSRVWDGKTPIRPGAAIALRAACERFTHIAVVVDAAGAEQRVFDAVCPSGADPLPFTLVADDKPGVERIRVVFSEARLDEPALHAALLRAERGETIWVDQLLLHKAVAKP
jgi:hypothetical protein